MGGTPHQTRGWWLALAVGLGGLPLVAAWDGALLAAARRLDATAMAPAFHWGTWLGYGALDVALLLALALAGWLRGNRPLLRRGLWGALAVAGAGLLGQLLKNGLCRARPTAPLAGSFFVDFPCVPAGYAVASFPSGHAVTAFAAAVLLALWYPRGTPAFLGAATLAALSRVVLGAHFPSDVLAGAILGAGVALAAWGWIEKREADH